MRILVLLLCLLLPSSVIADTITIPRKKFLRIRKALKVCKSIKKKHAVDLQAIHQQCSLMRKRDVALCRATKKDNTLSIVVVGIIGVVVGGAVGATVAVILNK